MKMEMTMLKDEGDVVCGANMSNGKVGGKTKLGFLMDKGVLLKVKGCKKKKKGAERNVPG